MSSTRQLLPFGDIDGPMEIADLERALAGLRAEAPRLEAFTTVRIAARIATVAEAWLAPHSPWMEKAKALPTGYTAPMIEWSLREIFTCFTPNALERLVLNELGSLEPFQDPRAVQGSAVARGARPMQLLYQVLASTVPPVAIEAIVLALLARAPLLLKVPSNAPHIAPLFLESLRSLAPDLARHVAVVQWRGGEGVLDDVACQRADAVAAYGSDATVNALMARCRFPTRFTGYGNRISFAVIADHGPQDAPLGVERLAKRLALDVAAYDQHGCMSPQAVFVSHRAAWDIDEIADALASHAFPAIAAALPSAPLEDAQAAAIQQARGVMEFRGRVLDSTDALVLVHRDAEFFPSPGGRTIRLIPYQDEEQLFDLIRPLAASISTVGVHLAPARATAFTGRLGRTGAQRICPIGRMQRPVWLRDHDGRPRIGDWVTWTNVEALY